MNSNQIRAEIFNISPHYPSWLYAALIVFLGIFIVIFSAGVVSFIGRKITADLQARVGPNLAPSGAFQPLIDAIKLLQKRPSFSHTLSESFWVVALLIALYSTLSVLP